MAGPAPQAPVRHCHSRGRGARPCHRLLPRAAGYHKRRRPRQGVSGGWGQCAVHGHHQGQLRDARRAFHFFYESVKLYEDLSQDLGYNLLFSQTGRLELAHTESSVYALRLRAEANAALGVDSRDHRHRRHTRARTRSRHARGQRSPSPRRSLSSTRGGHPPRRGNLGLRPRRRSPRRRDSPLY